MINPIKKIPKSITIKTKNRKIKFKLRCPRFLVGIKSIYGDGDIATKIVLNALKGEMALKVNAINV